MYCLTTEARGSKPKCFQSHVLSEGSRGHLSIVSSSFWWLQAALGLWQHNSRLCLCLTWLSPCVSVCPFLSLRRTAVMGFKAHPNLVWSHFNSYLSYFCKDPVSKQCHIPRLCVDMNFGRTPFKPPQTHIFLLQHLPSVKEKTTGPTWGHICQPSHQTWA